MGLSGFLYVAIVVGWAVYLVPFALKRYDEATRNRSIDRFSSAMRVLGRREGENDDVVARSTTVEAAAPRGATPRTAAPAAARGAAKVAAQRRRRVLLTLLFLTAATAGAAGLAFVEWWAVGAPGGLVVAWLVACRMQARRERVAYVRTREARTGPAPDRASGPASRADVAAAAGVVPEVVAPTADDEPTVVLQREDLDAAEAAHEVQGSLWDPVPVTLPTYVHKPRAPRTIRTIDLGAAGVQSSGHTEGHTAGHAEQHTGSTPVAEPAQEADEPTPGTGPGRRAVGE